MTAMDVLMFWVWLMARDWLVGEIRWCVYGLHKVYVYICKGTAPPPPSLLPAHLKSPHYLL